MEEKLRKKIAREMEKEVEKALKDENIILRHEEIKQNIHKRRKVINNL